MKILTTLLILLPVFAAAQTQSVEARQPATGERMPAHTPEWTNLNDSDPGTTDSTAPDLQRIVVLCATEPQSSNFKGQWYAYVRKNYETGMDVDAFVDDVLKRAAVYRARHKPDTQTRRLRATDASTRKMMHDAAMNAVRNMK